MSPRINAHLQEIFDLFFGEDAQDAKGAVFLPLNSRRSIRFSD